MRALHLVVSCFLLLAGFWFISAKGRTCTTRRSSYSVQNYRASYRAYYSYSYSCGWWGWSRCRRTAATTQYRSATRRITVYRTACCSGYTCSSSCHACCSPSCRNGGSCDTPNRCICSSGWTGSYCQSDVNECSRGSSCDRNAHCRNTLGSYTCSCRSGYQGNGRSCTDVNECLRRTHRCSSHATCSNTVGSYTCSCNSGYRGNGLSCSDINECSEGSDRCNSNARCTNTVGGYSCSCNNGYSGNGYYCNDINECQLNRDNCDANAYCTNTAGSFQCTCNNGYQGNGVTCADINECASRNGGCSQICHNTRGSYTCSCRVGFYLSLNHHSCEDVNECNSNNGGCQDNCHNTIGTYHCSCNNGYQLNGDGHTCEVPPPSPSDVTISNVGKRTATVTWDHPVISFLNTLTEIKGYRIIARQTAFNISDVVVDVPPSQTSYTFSSSLEEFTVYHCEVLAKNTFGYGSPSEAYQFKTLQDVPSSPPSDVYAVVKSSTLIWLHWSPPPPIHVNGLISYYTVKVHEMETGRNWTFVSIGTVLRIGSLHPYYNYSLSVVARTFGNGPYSNPIVSRTLEDAPTSHPGNVRVFDIRSTLFTMSWDEVPFADRNGIIRSYSVTLHELESGKITNISSNFTSLTINGLHPYYEYEATVKAKTILYGPNSPSVTLQLDEDAPSSGPNITRYFADSASLFLQWENPSQDTWNGIIREYYVVVEEEITGKSWTYITLNKNMTIFNLHPYYLYICRVHAFTIAMGPASEPAYVITEEDIPTGAPTNISLLQSTSISLTFTWEEPCSDKQNGKITSYECTLYDISISDFVEKIESNTTVVTISDLYPHTGYVFLVAAVNKVGTGPLSGSFFVRTDEDAPDEAPLNVTINEIDTDYAAVSWTPPSAHLHNGIIRYYTIEVQEISSTNFTKVLTTASHTTEIVDLHPYTDYVIRIAGHTVHTGPYSEPVYFQTLTDVPSGAPVELGYYNLTSNSAFFTWNLPKERERNGEIIEYTVTVVDLSNNDTNEIIQVTRESVYISDLDPFSYYSYSVAAATVVGYGPFSSHYIFRTDEDVPSTAPYNLTGSAVSSTSIFLSWNAPPSEELNGIFRGYHLFIKEVPTNRNVTLSVLGNEYVVSFLHPHYWYIISISAVTIGNGPFSDAITIQTQEDVPSSSPAILYINATSRFIYLSWSLVNKSDQNGIITGYTVYLIDLDNGEMNNKEIMTDNLHITLSDLIPYTTYGVMVSAHTIIGEGPQSNLSFIQTNEEAPIGKPTNVTAVTFDATSIHISWTHPPNDTHYGVIREYWLNVTEVETGNLTRVVVDSDKTEVILQSLHPYFTYHITIVPVTIEEGDNYTEITIRTAEDAPSAPPSGLAVLELLSRSAVFEWNPPAFEKTNGIIRKYLINVTGRFDDIQENMIILESHNTSLKVFDLHPYAYYSISVSAFTIKQGPYSVSLEIKTPEDIPSAPPKNISVSVLDSRTVDIRWQPPILKGQNGEIINYRVTIQDFNEMEYEVVYDVNGTKLGKIVNDVLPFHVYSIEVAAGTKVGFGPPSAAVLVEMPEDAPTHPPLAVEVIEVGVSNISIMWEPPPEEFHNGIIRHYKMSLTEIDTETSFTIYTSYLEHTFLHLHPFYTYNISVAAVTIAPGPYSAVVSAVTLETAPSSPPQNLIVTEITSRSFKAMWDLPLEEDHNGQLQDYTIVLISDTEVAHLTEENFILLDNLLPYTTYSIIVAASTQAGIGPFTEELSVKTEEDAPSVHPANLTVETILSSSIQLHWSPLELRQLNGELSHYLIKVLEEDTKTKSYITSNSNNYTLESLHPYYTYNISVSAVTILVGPYSEELTVTTLEDAPTSPPVNITVNSLSSTLIHVNWDHPPYESRNGIVRRYTCAITAYQPWMNISKVIEVNETEVNLTDLIPHTTYYISVRAITILPGPYSSTQPSKTLEDAPSKPPTNISIFINTSTSVEVTWITPPLKNLNGVIRYYVIKLRERNSSSENYTAFATLKKDSSPVHIEDFHPFYDYYIEVAAETIATGPYSEILSWKMPEDAPSLPPSNIRIKNITSSELLIQWLPPVESSQNGIIRGYFIQLMNSNTGESENYTTSAETSFLSISGLHPAHTYVIDMAAITILQGPFSDDIFVTMKEDVPSGSPEQLHVHITNATHIEAIWHPPIEDLQNGVIISYVINISADGKEVHLIYSNSTRVLLPLLNPYKEYSITVAASTQVGTGPFTAAVMFDTPETAPTGSPNNVSTYSITATSFMSHWLLPHSNVTNGLVRYFVVRIIENETNTTSAIRVYEAMKEFVGLHPYYTYTIEVAAYTVGLGPYSQPFVTITLEAAPSSPPRAIFITDVGTRHFNASWEPPQPSERNGIIRHYQVNIWRNNSVDEVHVVFTTSSGPSISVSSVLPYRVYFLAISAITNEQGPESSPIVFQTLEDAPSGAPTQFQAINVTSRTLILTWYMPEQEDINGMLRGYYLSVSEHKSPIFEDIKFNTIATQHVLKDLIPYTVYDCSVSGITVDEGPAATIQVRTAQEAPGLPPEGVMVQVHDSCSMTLTWRPPSAKHNGIIIGYNVNVTLAYMDSTPVQYFINATSLDLNELVPYSTYHIKVAAVTVAVGPYSDFIYASIPETAPSMTPQNLSIIISSSSSVHMSWQPPPDDHINGVLRSYSISVLSIADSAIIHSDIVDHETLEAEIDDLHPYYHYTFSVAAVTTEDGPSANITVQMSTDIPSGPPLSVEVTLTGNTALMVSWEPPEPENQNGIIQSYVVEFVTLDTNKTDIFTWNQLYYEFLELHPFYTYQYKIAASTSAGVGPHTDPAFYLMPPSKPSCSVENITVSVILSSTIILSWMPPNHSCWNGIITNYTITAQCLGPQNLTLFEEMDNSTKSILFSSNHIIFPNSENVLRNDPDPRSGNLQMVVPETLLISHLQPFFKYIFVIYMSNVVGDSNSTSSDEVSLPGKEPTAPPEDIKVQATSSTSLGLSFKLPNVLTWNGIISGFLVELYHMTDDLIRQQNFSAMECFNGCQIAGLKPYTNYTFTVVAFSSFGIGTYSRNYTAQTMEDIPGRPLNLTVKNYGSVYFISWKPPSNPNGVILGYKLHYYTSSSSLVKRDAEKVIETKSLHTVLSITNHQYVFKVRARTSVGYGDYSDEVIGQMIEPLKAASKNSVNTAGVFGWIVAVIFFIIFIIIFIIYVIVHILRKYKKKNKVLTDAVEMTPNREWKENELYQDCETVERRHQSNQVPKTAFDLSDSMEDSNENKDKHSETQEVLLNEEEEEGQDISFVVENKFPDIGESVPCTLSDQYKNSRENSECKDEGVNSDDDSLHENISQDGFLVNSDTEHMIK